MKISLKVDILRLQIVSDLHLEFLSREQVIDLANKISENTLAQVLILAGDICSWNKDSILNLYTFLDVIEEHYKNIIYVLGNHEYYGTSKQKVHELADKVIKKYIPSLSILENKAVTIENVTFYGTTLWFNETVDTYFNKYSLNDYRYIEDFTPDVWSRKAISYIRSIPDDDNLEDKESLCSSKKVLITHHVPHSRFISPKYVGSDLNCFYLNEIGKYLNKFDLVTFGHSHNSVYQQFSNRCLAVSNPRGYLKSNTDEGENDNFQYQLIVEV